MANVIDLLNNDPRPKTWLRHPEKVARPDNPILRKPPWIRAKFNNISAMKETQNITAGLTTVCQEAACPNISECWAQRHASFLIMGDTCTRACAFCNVATGMPKHLDPDEPQKVADATAALGLAHIVITSVDRDDLSDGGADHYAKTIRAIRKTCPETTIELLTPDFLRKDGALETVVEAKPDVFNHNIETVPSLYVKVRPGARYYHSIRLLEKVKELDKDIFTKSGIMLGLGETRNEILQVMDDMRCANIDFMTMGQYLAPSSKHWPVDRFVTPEEFDSLKVLAQVKGFLYVASSPMTRSSHHAGEDFKKLQNTRREKK